MTLKFYIVIEEKMLSSHFFSSLHDPYLRWRARVSRNTNTTSNKLIPENNIALVLTKPETNKIFKSQRFIKNDYL